MSAKHEGGRMEKEVKRTSFTGKFFRNIYSGSDGFSIMKVSTSDFENIPVSITTETGRAYATVLGAYLPELESVDIRYYGEWTTGKYGPQFEADSFEIESPTTKKGMIAFLSSDIFPGIGKKTAERIVEKFGTNSLNIIANQPKRLLEIRGISPERLGRIVAGYIQAQSYSELAMFLAEYGISGNILMKINEKYGNKALSMIQKDPYSIMDVAGVGFKTCDKIARGLSVSLDSFTRIKSAISESIRSLCEREGGMYVDINDMFTKSMSVLNDGITPPPVTKERYKEAFQFMIDHKLIALRSKKLVYLIDYDNAERDVALKILNMLSKPVGASQAIIASLNKWCESATIQPSVKQKEAVINSLQNRMSIITGGPGTGKTTITKAIIDVYKDVFHLPVTCMAPTGKAATNMQSNTGEVASTIHSRLHIYDDENCIPESIEEGLVIIDETSMVDNLLMKHIMESINPNCQLLLCGDVDQLPSVGVGAVLSELIKSGIVPTSILKEVFRQQEGSAIIDNAIKINTGKQDLIYNDDFVFVEAKSEDDATRVITEIYQKEVHDWGIDNVALLAPLRRTQNGRLKCVSDALNPVLQDYANPEDKIITSGGIKSCKIGDREYRVGDRVLQWKNKKDSSNGEIGEILDIYDDEEEYGLTVHIIWGNGNEVHAHKADMETISLAYSMSIHKSQGSQYDCVIIPVLSSQKCQLFNRNLLYTGVTRAKKKVILVGDKRAISEMIRKTDNNKRKTLLAERLKYNAKIWGKGLE